MERQYDVLVVGSGSAGQSAASLLVRAGLKVAMADSRPFGGTCAQRGCVPKKVLFSAAEAVMRARALMGQGVAGRAGLDWPRLMAFKRGFTQPVPEATRRELADAGIDAYPGRARFSGPQTVRLGETTIAARHILLANGSRPAPLNIPGEEHLSTSDAFLELDELPDELVFVGGGYISCELSHVAAVAGASVRILHQGERILEHYDPGLVAQLVAASEELGIKVHTNSPVAAIERRPSGRLVVRTEGGQSFECALAVHGAGRVADIADLDCEAAGVETSPHGVVVNDYLQSVSNPAVYAAGDAASSGLQLTPVAVAQGRVAAHNIVSGNERRFEPGAVPSTVFTQPPLAMVGLTEEEAARQGLDVTVNRQDMSGWQTTRRVGLRHAGGVTLTDRATGRLVGAHLLGHHAEEVINLLALAMNAGLSAGRLKQMLWVFPTSAHDVRYLL